MMAADGLKVSSISTTDKIIWGEGRERTHIRETACGQCHGDGTHQCTGHNQQVRVGVLHADADLTNKRQDDQGRNRVRDETGNHKNQNREDEEHAVKAEMFDPCGDARGNGVQQARRRHSLTKTQTTGGENDNGPQEVVEILFVKDSGTEEQQKRKDSDHAHIAKDVLKLMTGTPERDGEERDDTDEILDTSEAVFDRPDRNDSGIATRVESHQEEEPD